MKYYVVMHGQSAKKVMGAGIIWAPKSTKNGYIHHWERVSEVKKGDIIFQAEKGKINAIAKATADAISANKPAVLADTDWGKQGYLVNAEYLSIKNPLVIKEHIDELLPFLPVVYSPFQHDGTGNQGYLFPCNDQLAMKIIDIIRHENYQQTLNSDGNSENDDNTTRAITTLEETQYETKTIIRRGQQTYKKEISEFWGNECPICGIKEINVPGISVLVGSHSKPWKDSDPSERLDKYNGLLLCENHDSLFDRGIITFNKDGRIIISDALPKEGYDKYFLNVEIHIPLNEQQKKYMDWHRTHVFEKFKKKNLKNV